MHSLTLCGKVSLNSLKAPVFFEINEIVGHFVQACAFHTAGGGEYLKGLFQ